MAFRSQRACWLRQIASKSKSLAAVGSAASSSSSRRLGRIRGRRPWAASARKSPRRPNSRGPVSRGGAPRGSTPSDRNRLPWASDRHEETMGCAVPSFTRGANGGRLHRRMVATLGTFFSSVSSLYRIFFGSWYYDGVKFLFSKDCACSSCFDKITKTL
jgi:hypothetical protein